MLIVSFFFSFLLSGGDIEKNDYWEGLEKNRWKNGGRMKLRNRNGTQRCCRCMGGKIIQAKSKQVESRDEQLHLSNVKGTFKENRQGNWKKRRRRDVVEDIL